MTNEQPHPEVITHPPLQNVERFWVETAASLEDMRLKQPDNAYAEINMPVATAAMQSVARDKREAALYEPNPNIPKQ